ncbi:hypothetical protein BFL38_01635 [Brachyspira hampsonii]|uniref:Pentapeptide repeat-containing protein n=1 Tax=Brachyspira hampsonii TaxID=1287055 RepID=A0A1E5NBD0_9SPIR|nr:hypothetical protein [Brachyspira hampsonii]OEJ13476.1 hypothetical protein BFL38_01635 [Brachyspira hampsonii]
MAICKQKISNTENCPREEYKDGLCIIHHNSNDKPEGLFRRIIRDDIYRGFYNFSYMISYEGFNFEGLKIEKNSNMLFSNSLFYGPFQMRNFNLFGSLDFTDSNFESGLFITMSNVYKEIIIKNSKINIDFNMSLSNLHSIDIDNITADCNFSIANSDIIDKLSFNHIHFKDNFSMLNASLQGESSFENIIIDGDADFRNMVFYKSLKFENVEIKGKTIPYEITENEKIEFVNVLINGRVIEDNQKEKKEKEKKESQLEKIKEAKDKMYKETLLNNKYSKRK